MELRLALSEEEFAPASTVPRVPTLVVAGSKDPTAVEAPQLADWVQQMGLPPASKRFSAGTTSMC
ncbi:hypothetical protein [Nesterenkonia pannonica]|uniref:hypothetical protein n=1 Tax=Nesterenkonia pannonica TaxID=1548602 RepID=UPI002164E204|nr:hypothetical protein [Nesterenkonia pannonica]